MRKAIADSIVTLCVLLVGTFLLFGAGVLAIVFVVVVAPWIVIVRCLDMEANGWHWAPPYIDVDCEVKP